MYIGAGRRSSHRLLAAICLLWLQTLAQASENAALNGFFTAAVGKMSNEKIRYQDYGNDLYFDSDSIMGMQVDFQLDSQSHFISQLVAKGQNAYAIDVDWSYLSHSVSEGLDIRAGRLRVPFYMYSETLEIGYSYPWIRPPSETYEILPFNNFSGVQAYWNSSRHDWDLSSLLYTGSLHENINLLGYETDMTVADITGLVLLLEQDWLLLRLGYNQAKASLNITALEQQGGLYDQLGIADELREQLQLREKKGRFYELGAKFNHGQFQAIAEMTLVRLQRSLIPTHRSWYTMLGYQLGEHYLLHATYSTVKSEPHYQLLDGLAPEVAAGLKPILVAAESFQHSYTLGLRYDYAAGMALKGEWQRFFVNAGHGTLVRRGETDLHSHSDLFVIAIDVAF